MKNYDCSVENVTRLEAENAELREQNSDMLETMVYVEVLMKDNAFLREQLRKYELPNVALNTLDSNSPKPLVLIIDAPEK